MELTKELQAFEGSFLLELRTELSWNHESFISLASQLYEYCQKTKKSNKLERSMASAIWYISTFIRDWTEHDSFPKNQSEEYYSKSYELLKDLAEFYFAGTSAYTNDEQLLNKLHELKSIANKCYSAFIKVDLTNFELTYIPTGLCASLRLSAHSVLRILSICLWQAEAILIVTIKETSVAMN